MLKRRDKEKPESKVNGVIVIIMVYYE